VGIFRRSKPLHERLAEQGGLVEAPAGRPAWTGAIGETGIHGVPREREYDAVVTVTAPDVEGDAARFVALGDGTLIVEEGEGELAALAEAIEQEVERPYRAVAVRRSDAQWAVAGKAVRLVELPEPGGDEVELVLNGEERTLVVDGNREFGTLPALEALAGGDAVIRASRLDGNVWEVRVDPL
jgi:hypothetical protein